MNVLVVAAHPDDEILGVGGTLLKHIESGHNVYVCVLTKAFEPKWSKEYMQTKIKEQKEVDRILGIRKRFNLDYTTTKLNTVAHGEINQSVIDVFSQVKPDVVYTHFEKDLNYDHTVTFGACMVAARPPVETKLFCFETLSETEWNNKPFLPNYWVDISKFIDKKTEAFEIYRSEVKTYPHPRSKEGIKALAQKRGTEICVQYAEAFQVIKDGWR